MNAVKWLVFLQEGFYMTAHQVGWAGAPMHLDWRREEAGMGSWRKTWKRGIKMRRNVVAGNFQGWRLFSNSDCPVSFSFYYIVHLVLLYIYLAPSQVTELSPSLDMNRVKQRLADFPKLSVNDDLKIDWCVQTSMNFLVSLLFCTS